MMTATKSIKSLRFRGFLLWFVFSPGGETPGGTGKALGGLWGASRGSRTPGPGPNN